MHQVRSFAALADEMNLSFAEVFETATFYAHFDIVKEGEPSIAPLTIRVCDSLTCAMLGDEKLLEELKKGAGPGIDPDQQCRDAVVGARHRREGRGLVEEPSPP